ncbi:MAG: hypothetical protein NLN64_04570 [Candidatus Thalassarchaeaceae archaeon]|nr:hypothetical protein [Candidatus Thalassarchaeaceae archaeon]
MSRWRRRRKAKPLAEEPHMRGARMWLQDLRELCEMSFDNHIEGQRKVREMQVEWIDAHKKVEISDLLLDGLDRRAFRLLRSDVKEWLEWLDNDRFWEPGWKDEVVEE